MVIVTAGVTPEEQQEEADVESALLKMSSHHHSLDVRFERVWGLTMYHVDDLPYKDVCKELPMSFAPFGRAVRGNFKAADSAAVARARNGEAGVKIREELCTPSEFHMPAAEVLQHSLEDLEN